VTPEGAVDWDKPFDRVLQLDFDIAIPRAGGARGGARMQPSG